MRLHHFFYKLIGLTGIDYIFAGSRKGRGCILQFQDICKNSKTAFHPLQYQSITPEFFESLLSYFKKRKIDVVSINEALDRISTSRKSDNYFVVLTFDLGFKSTLYTALPLLAKYEYPFTTYIATSFADGTSQLWWKSLADIINQTNAVGYLNGNQPQYLQCQTAHQKYTAYNILLQWVKQHSFEEQHRILKDFTKRNRYDGNKICQEMMMNWDEIYQLDQHPLSEIGLHGVYYRPYKNVNNQNDHANILNGMQIFLNSLNRKAEHFSFPLEHSKKGMISTPHHNYNLQLQNYGLRSGVTGEYGVLKDNLNTQQFQLPRIIIDGGSQSLRTTRVLMHGKI